MSIYAYHHSPNLSCLVAKDILRRWRELRRNQKERGTYYTDTGALERCYFKQEVERVYRQVKKS